MLCGNDRPRVRENLPALAPPPPPVLPLARGPAGGGRGQGGTLPPAAGGDDDRRVELEVWVSEGIHLPRTWKLEVWVSGSPPAVMVEAAGGGTLARGRALSCK